MRESLFKFYLDYVITMISKHGDLHGIETRIKKLVFFNSVLLTDIPNALFDFVHLGFFLVLFWYLFHSGLCIIASGVTWSTACIARGSLAMFQLRRMLC